MFYGNFQHWGRQKGWFPARFDRAMAFAVQHGLAGLTGLDNKTYEIAGRDIFALLQQPATEPEEWRRFELHRDYIDIQLLLEGTEKQLFAPPPLAGEAALLEDRLDEADNAFYARPAHCNAIILQPGDYVAYLPGELHCPNCAPDPLHCGRIRKVVFKIRRNV